MSNHKACQDAQSKAKARKQARLAKTADNAELAAILAQNAPGRALAAAVGVKVKRQPSQKAQIKAIKRRILKSGGLWSQAVRRRDGNRCVMCGATGVLHAHHYLFHRAHSMALAVDPANGATLDYTCHIIRVHQRADGDFIARLLAKMETIVGEEKTWQMRETAKHPQPLGLDFWIEAEQKLTPKNNPTNRALAP